MVCNASELEYLTTIPPFLYNDAEQQLDACDQIIFDISSVVCKLPFFYIRKALEIFKQSNKLKHDFHSFGILLSDPQKVRLPKRHIRLNIFTSNFVSDQALLIFITKSETSNMWFIFHYDAVQLYNCRFIKILYMLNKRESYFNLMISR